MAKRSNSTKTAKKIPTRAQRFENWQGSNWIRREKRLAIYSRDGFCCVYCGKKQSDGHVLSLDHVLAVEHGGTNGSNNLVTACLSCNSSKSDLTLTEWFKVLRGNKVNTRRLAAVISERLNTEIDMVEGRRLLAAYKAAKRTINAA